MRRDGPKGAYAAPGLEKAFAILELLADHRHGVTITEMSTLLDRSVGELFRIVIVMERRGYLQKSPVTDRYSLAYKLLEVVLRATPTNDLVETALPQMRALIDDTGQSCHLVVLNDAHGLVIARQENPGIRGFALRVGATIDLATSCSGNVLIAFASNETRARLIEPVGDRPALLARGDAIRRNGYDLRKSPITFGVTDISYPLFGFDQSLAGALTIPFLELIDGSQKVDLETARRRLGDAARDISLRLGWRPAGTS